MSVLAVSCAIENAPPAQITATSLSRVGSPSAAKTAARAALERAIEDRPASRRPVPSALALCADMTRDAFQLRFPPTRVHAERFEAPLRRHAVEAGFDDSQQRAVA